MSTTYDTKGSTFPWLEKEKKWRMLMNQWLSIGRSGKLKNNGNIVGHKFNGCKAVTNLWMIF
jgi:hypothetical protein